MTNKRDSLKWWIGAAKEAYTAAYGEEKWQSLTPEEMHDVAMTLAKMTLRTLELMSESVEA